MSALSLGYGAARLLGFPSVVLLGYSVVLFLGYYVERRLGFYAPKFLDLSQAVCGCDTLIHWYERGEVSQEKAARIVGMDRKDFLLSLASEKANAFVVDFEDLKRDLGCP